LRLRAAPAPAGRVPYAKTNYVDHPITDQSSILKFIEDNWSTGRIGDNSFDQLAGPINGMFDFGKHGDVSRLILDPRTGQPTDQHQSTSVQSLFRVVRGRGPAMAIAAESKDGWGSGEQDARVTAVWSPRPAGG
jgi:phospholipase C